MIRTLVILMFGLPLLAIGQAFSLGDKAFSYRAEFSNQSHQFFKRLSTQPTFARKLAYDRMIRGLVASSVWQKLDTFYVLAAADSTTARVNLIQSAFTATETGSPSFVADAGYTGANGTGTYLDTNFSPTSGSPNFSQNSSGIFAWRASHAVDDAGGIVGIFADTWMIPSPVDGKFYSATTGGTISGGDLGADNAWALDGLFLATRNGGVVSSAWINGVPFLTPASGAASTSLTAGQEMQILNNGLGRNTGSSAQIAFAGCGSYLTPADTRNLYTGLAGYLQDIGGAAALLKYSSDVVNDGANNYTPGFGRLVDGRLISVYCVGHTTPQQNGKIVYQTSRDGGRRWSAASDIVTPAALHSYSDTSVTVLESGMILISVMYQANDLSTVATKVIQGTVAGDLSISWGSPIDVGSTGTKPCTSSYILPLSDGRLMLGIYIAVAPDKGVRVKFSSDDGATWGGETVVAADGGGEEYNEANFVQLANDDIVGIIRGDGSNKGYYRVVSTNAGVTWSSPFLVIDNTLSPVPARPAIALCPDGTIFMVNRFLGPAGNLQTGYCHSTDNGVTWSAPQIYYNTGTKTYGQHVYAQGIYDDRSRSIMYVIGQGSFVSAQMNFQQFALP